MKDLRIGLAGAQSGPTAFTTTLETTETKARHRRFFRNKQRRDLAEREKRQFPPEPEEEEEDSPAEPPGPPGEPEVDSVSSPSADSGSDANVNGDTDDSSEEEEGSTTLPQATPAAVTAEAPSPTLSSTTIPVISPTVNSNPPLSTVPLPTLSPEPSSSSSSSSSSSISDNIPATSSSLTPSAVPVTALPDNLPTSIPATAGFQTLVSSSSSSPTLSRQVSTTANLPIAATGAGSAMAAGISAPVDGKMVAAVVFGIVGAAFAILLVVWLFIRARRAKAAAAADNTEKPPLGQIIFGEKWKWSSKSTTTSEGRIWGEATTSGAPTEAGDFEAYIPPLMQKGGKYDPDKPQGYNNYSNTAASSRLPEGRPSTSYETRLQDPRTSLYPTPPMPTKDKASVTRAPPPRVGEDGLILAPSRWFGRDSAALSVVSIPRFRDIKSWARDQRTRVESKSRWSESTVEPVPSLPSGRYSRIDD